MTPKRVPAKEAFFLMSACAAAFVHVLFWSAAWPVFDNVDEQAHFDLAVKYAQGDVPRGLPAFGPSDAELIVRYGSPEYTYADGARAGRPVPPPLWRFSPQDQARYLRLVAPAWSARLNHEGTQPPVYYVLAAVWSRLGLSLGMRGGDLVYWLRFLNAGLLVLTLVLAFACLRRFYPDRPFLYIGVPLVLALMPQTAFYSINNDAAAPLFFGAAFYALMEVASADAPSLALCAMAGLAVALAFLEKLSNAAVWFVLAAVVLWRPRRRGAGARCLASLCLAAGLPVLIWMARTHAALGEWLGTGLKAKALGWTLKPVGAWLPHPLFTARGFSYFCAELVKSLWRGEFTWHAVELTSRLDAFYVAATVLCLAAAAIPLLRRKGREEFHLAFVRFMSFAAVIIPVLLLAWGSIAYDFGDCPHPSRALPFVATGRLLLGSLIPFLALYLDGLERLLSVFKSRRLPWIVLGLLLAAMVVSEAAMGSPALASPYNWFHLPVM